MYNERTKAKDKPSPDDKFSVIPVSQCKDTQHAMDVAPHFENVLVIPHRLHHTTPCFAEKSTA